MNNYLIWIMVLVLMSRLKVWKWFFSPHLEDKCTNLIIKSNKFNCISRKKKNPFFPLISSYLNRKLPPHRCSSLCSPISTSVSGVFIKPDSSSADDKDVRLPLKRRTAGVRGLHGWRTAAHLSPHHTNSRPSRRTMADVPPPLRFHFS